VSENPIQNTPPSTPLPPRAASVTLRTESVADDSAVQLDAANQSLADALKLVFTGIKFAMFGLVAYFVVSGFQMIKETESGIRLLFGRVTGDNLPSGPRFSWPYPLGEMLRIDTGAVTLELEDSFMPLLSPDQKKLPIATVAQQGVKLSLKPGEDGSLITGDANIAHTKWKVLYIRSRPRDFVEHVYPEHEKQIVKAAVEKGVVQAVSVMKIDDLLKQSSGELGAVATRAREIAQRSLDDLKSGIELRQLTLQEKAPPLSVFAEFNKVQSAEQSASQQANNAESVARNILNEMAGAAFEPLIRQIDLYEAALEKKDLAAQDEALNTINALLAGDPVSVGGTPNDKMISGKANAILNDANQYRTSIVSRRRGEVASFEAKWQQFKSNPEVMIQRDWADALAALLARPVVETYMLPPGTDTMELNINRDQEFERVMERARKERMADDVKKKREEDQAKARLVQPTDQLELQATPKSGSR
jgi:regulator of protease activity HflC (stomatin/prohibitin superfamily)